MFSKTNKYRLLILGLIIMMVMSSLSGCSRKNTADVNEKLELAVKYLSEQNYEQAILAYQEVIKIDSKNVKAYKGMSLAYQMQAKPDQAEQALQDGLNALPQNTELQLAMAGFIADQGKPDQAEAIYKQLIAGASPSIASYQAYIDFLKQQGKIADAIALLEQVAANNDYRINTLLAEIYLKNGDKEKAIVALNKSIASQPEQSSIIDLLTEVYRGKWADLMTLGNQYIDNKQVSTGEILKISALLGMEQYEKAVALYSDCSNELQDNIWLKYLTAQAYYKLGQLDKSMAMIKPIQVSGIQDAGLIADLAALYLADGDKATARQLAMQGIAIDQNLSDNYFIICQSYVDEDNAMQKYWETKFLLANTASIKQGNNKLNLMIAQVYLDKADALRRAGDYTNALVYNNKAVDLAPDYYMAYASRAATYNYLQQYTTAITDSTKAIGLEANDPWAYDERAWSYNALGEFNKAVSDEIIAISIDPGFYYSYNILSWAYRGLGQYDKSIDIASRGIAINPNYGFLYASLGWTYSCTGQYDLAKTNFQKASAFADSKATAIDGLNTLAQMGY